MSQSSSKFKSGKSKKSHESYCLMLQKSGIHSPVEVTVVEIPLFTGVLAPSKRWLALGFLNLSTKVFSKFGKVVRLKVMEPTGENVDCAALVQMSLVSETKKEQLEI